MDWKYPCDACEYKSFRYCMANDCIFHHADEIDGECGNTECPNYDSGENCVFADRCGAWEPVEVEE